MVYHGPETDMVDVGDGDGRDLICLVPNLGEDDRGGLYRFDLGDSLPQGGRNPEAC